jgi:NTP pyrophosphatase (non-canonical NTP hydrolase)
MNDLQELTNQIIEFTEERDWDQFHSPENLAKSIAIEAGELLECYQWDSNADPAAVEEELADILNYSLLLASKLQLDPIEIVKKKLAISAQKYPVEKSRGRSTKYDKL